MSRQQQIEEEIIATVSQLAASLRSGRNVVADMSALEAVTSCLPLSNLDNWERIVRQGIPPSCASLPPAKWKFWNQPAPCLPWMDLCSGDGFRRERALRAISGAAPNSFFLALAIRRLNDWVPEVRAAACEKLPDIAIASRPEDVVDVLCAVFPHWRSWGRMQAEGKKTLMQIASMDAVVQRLKSCLVCGTAGPLASVMAQAAKSPALDGHFLEIAHNAIQPSVRAKAYKFLLEGKVVWLTGRQWEWIDLRYCKGQFKPLLSERPLSVNVPLEETVRAASADRSSLVRHIALDLLIRKPEAMGPAALQLATVLAADPHAAVAERGEFARKRLAHSAPPAALGG